jgi:hypothetical protein
MRAEAWMLASARESKSNDDAGHERHHEHVAGEEEIRHR